MDPKSPSGLSFQMVYIFNESLCGSSDTIQFDFFISLLFVQLHCWTVSPLPENQSHGRVLNIPDEAANHKMYVLNNLVALYNNFTPLSIVKSLVSA